MEDTLKNFKILLLLTCLTIGMPSYASEEAKKLFDILEMEKSFNQTIKTMVDIQLKQQPELLPFKDVILDFFQKHMNYESLKPEMVKIYTEAFNEFELKKINSFYATPTGQKTIKLMPILVNKGAQIGQKKVADNIQELQRMIKQRIEQLKQK